MKNIVTYINENQEFFQVSVNLNNLKNIDKAKDNEKINIICKAFINILYNYKYNNKKNSYIYDFCVDNIHGSSRYSLNSGKHFNGEEIGGYNYSLGWSKYWDDFIDELLDEYDLDEYYIEISGCRGAKSKKLLDLIKDYLDDVTEYNSGYIQIKFSDLIKKNVYESIYALYKELVDKNFKL